MGRGGAVLCKSGEDALGLDAPFAAAQAEMRRNDAQRAALEGEIDIDRAARLASGDTEIDMTHFDDRQASQHEIAEAAAERHVARRRYRPQAGRRRKEALLVERRGAVAAPLDLLKADDVGGEVAQNGS